MSNHLPVHHGQRPTGPRQRSDFHRGPYDRQVETLVGIMTYPMDRIVAQYARDHHVPPEIAKEHERELKRYLALAALNPTHDYSMTGPVDGLWHTFILFTREYAAFCQEFAGRFLHHCPEARIDAGQDESDITVGDALEWYGVFLHEYAAAFGEAPPAHVWPDLRRFPVAETTALSRICSTESLPAPRPRPDHPRRRNEPAR